MSHRMTIAGTILALAIAHDAAGQSAAGPVAGQPATVASYERVVTGLLGNGSDDRLWSNMTPESRREFVDKVNKLQQDITVQMPVGPVAPVPPKPVPPKPKPGPPPPAPTHEDFEKSLTALRETLQKAKKTDPTYVLTAPVNTDIQQVVEKLSNATRK
jgi:hypothetical protein